MGTAAKKKYNDPFSATMTGIRDLFRKQIPAGELRKEDRLDGKTVLVDGASSGLGFAIATEIARRGATVIMACRSGIPEKGEKIRQITGNRHVHMVHVDFSDLVSIRRMVEELKSAPFSATGIDILISNAGIVPKKSRKTVQGLEEMFVVNYFSKFYFIHLMIGSGLLRGCRRMDPSEIEEMGASEVTSDKHQKEIPSVNGEENRSRVIFVASESHRNPEGFDWENFGKYRDYGIGKSMELYGYYKLLLTTFSVELSRRLNPDGVLRCPVFSMCPGPVNSNIAREAPKLFQPLLKLVFSIFFRSPARAAIPVVYLAASPDVKDKAFDYLFLMSRKEVDEKASDQENGRRLWQLSLTLLKEHS